MGNKCHFHIALFGINWLSKPLVNRITLAENKSASTTLLINLGQKQVTMHLLIDKSWLRTCHLAPPYYNVITLDEKKVTIN